MSKPQTVLLWLMAALYVAAGANHFRDPDFYVSIMPPYVPWHLPMVYLSGVAEIALGAAVLIPRLRRAAAWGLVALLIAVFPANVHMALNVDVYPDASAAALYLRLPVQGLLIAWAWWFTRATSARPPDEEAAARERSEGSPQR